MLAKLFSTPDLSWLEQFIEFSYFLFESCSVAQAGVQWCCLGSLHLPPSRFKVAGITGLQHYAQLISVLLVEMGFHHVGLQLLISKMRFYHVGQVGLELLTSSNPPTSASQSAGITGMSHCARPPKRDLERDLEVALFGGGDTERAFEGGIGCGELERDWLLDTDFDFISPFPFSLGDRDRDLLRDFSYSSLDLLRECEWEPRSDLGLDLLFDLDFLPFDRERDRPLLRDLELDKRKPIFSKLCKNIHITP
ncbi:hypothetical protein AAY473_035160 [Plecturocebus cupreus]